MYEARGKKENGTSRVISRVGGNGIQKERDKNSRWKKNDNVGNIIKTPNFCTKHCYNPVQLLFSGNNNGCNWENAITYIGKNDVIYSKLESSTEDIIIEEKKQEQEQTTEDDNRFSVISDNKGKIEWNPKTNIFFGNPGENTKGKVSPAATLYHEMGHAAQWLEDKAIYSSLVGRSIKDPNGFNEPILDLHNLANNEIPFNKNKMEPIRYLYSDAKIETEGLPTKVKSHTPIDRTSYYSDENLFPGKKEIYSHTQNCIGMSLKDISLWSKIYKDDILEIEDLKDIDPLVCNIKSRKTALENKIIKDKTKMEIPYRYRNYREFAQTDNNELFTVKSLLKDIFNFQ